MKADISIKYTIYELNPIERNGKKLLLEPVEFRLITNSFDTEEEAINALILNDKSYIDFVILKQVFIRS